MYSSTFCQVICNPCVVRIYILQSVDLMPDTQEATVCIAVGLKDDPTYDSQACDLIK